MNVANLELCKELYELSGWENTDHIYATVTGADPQVFHNSDIGRLMRETNSEFVCSAYDAGFLLRKLPQGTSLIHYVKSAAYRNRKQYGALVKSGTSSYPWSEADTPENALCKLAIELFKSGVLKKGIGDE